MDACAAKGLKKLFSLARTKMRLAEDAGTAETRPKPLPLVKLLSGIDVSTVADCRRLWADLKTVDYSDDLAVASAALQLFDIVEGVKYLFEPPEYMPLMGAGEFAALEWECKGAGRPLHILLMSGESQPCSVYVGENPPEGTRHYSRVVSGIAPLLHSLYRSEYFSDGRMLRNVCVDVGARTLLGDAAAHALKTYSREGCTP